VAVTVRKSSYAYVVVPIGRIRSRRTTCHVAESTYSRVPLPARLSSAMTYPIMGVAIALTLVVYVSFVAAPGSG